MAKILSITLNPAIDLTVQLDQLKVGEVNRQLTAQSHAAGKGLNVAQVLKDLGHELIVSGFLGQENRQIFDHHIQQEQFDNQFIYVAGQTRQNIKVAEASGQMTDINGKGFFVDTSAKQQLCERLSQLILEVDVIVIAGSLPQGFSAEELSTLILWLQSAGKKVAVDTSGVALKAAIAAHPAGGQQRRAGQVAPGGVLFEGRADDAVHSCSGQHQTVSRIDEGACERAPVSGMCASTR